MESALTIAIPVFNRAEFFPAALASALAQTLPVPILVVDNASTAFDFEKAVRDCGDPRVRYHRNPTNVGMVENWNQCLRLPGTPWVSILHDDDVLYPQATEWLSRAIAERPGRGLYFGLDDAMDESGRATRNKTESDPAFVEMDPRDYVIQNQFCACGFAMDREKALAIGGYDRRRRMTADWEMYTRMCVRHGAVRVNRVICAYREPIFRNSGTADLAIRGVSLPSFALQRRRNIRDYEAFTGTSSGVSPRLHQAAMAQRLLGQIGHRMTRRGLRAARLYAELEPPQNRWKALAYRVSPRLFTRLMVWFSYVAPRKSPPPTSSPQ